MSSLLRVSRSSLSEVITQGQVLKWAEGRRPAEMPTFWDKMDDKDSEKEDENEECSGKRT